MATLDNTTAENRLDSFDVYRIPYKAIGDHQIEAGILIPKNLPPGKHPLVVKFHGGGLVNGDCLYTPWISSFFVPFLHRNSAITILPNYRLTPESRGSAILSDLSSFWTWLLQDGQLDTFLATQKIPLTIDYTRLLVSGESAGGYMALQSALTLPKGQIKAVLLQYPMTNFLRRTPEDRPFGMTPPPEKWLNEYIASLSPESICSSSNPTTDERRRGLSMALNAYGRFNEFFGTGKELWPITKVEEVEWVPPMTIFHGREDSAVGVGDSEAFVEKARKLKGVEGEDVRLVVREGDHGFDVKMREENEEWLREELRWVEGKWLG